MQNDLFSRLHANAQDHPDKPALIYPAKGKWETLSYAQLLVLTDLFTSGLSACALTAGMRAAVMTPPSIEFFAFAFALLRLGIVPVIVDPAIGLKRLTTCFQETEPEVFIGNTLTHALRILFGWGRTTLKHHLTLEGIKRRGLKSDALEPRLNPAVPGAPAAIIFTSGSTGAPKGVLYSQENFSAQLDMFGQCFHITTDEIDLPAFPLYVIIDLLLGVTSVIPDVGFPVPRKTDPKKVLNAIETFKITNMFASPVVLELLSTFMVNQGATAATRFKRLSSLKRVITAGAPATIALQEKVRTILDDKTDLFGTYGATESLPVAIVESREIFALAIKAAEGAGVCLGRSIAGVTVRIIKITEAPIDLWQESLSLDHNVVGEITVQSPATTRTYVQRQTENRLSKIKFGDEVIHRTGDLGYLDVEGRLWFCGRKSQRVETRYGTFFTEQIEGIFNTHPSVHRTALVGVDQEPVLWVESKPGKLNEALIRQELLKLAAHHPQAMNIKSLLFIGRFPTDIRHNSKIIREKLCLLAQKRLR
jgi:olefin beta-lactone synthetase